MGNSGKIRVSSLAKELKLDTRRLIEELRREGVAIKSPSESISKGLANKIYDKHKPPCQDCGEKLERLKAFEGCCYACYCKRRLSTPACRGCGQNLWGKKALRGFCYTCYCERHQPTVRGIVQGGIPGLPSKQTLRIGKSQGPKKRR